MNTKYLTKTTHTKMDTQDEADSAINLLSRAILPKVNELARSGRYLEAESLLQHLIQEGGTLPAIYDLLARIRAQQGQLLEAQIFWAQATQLNTNKESYRAALKCIEKLQVRPAWLRWTGRILLVLIIISGIISGMVAVPAIQLSKLKLPTFNIDIDKPVIRSRPKVVSVNNPLPKITIRVPGILVDTQTNQMLLSFESGLFLHRSELRPEAKVTLDALAAQLQPYIGKIHVHVEGHTDDIPINNLLYHDNVSLGLHRAVVVVEYLRLTSRFPAKMFTASGLGEQPSLYPNDTLHNKLRNRTVIIRIMGTNQ